MNISSQFLPGHIAPGHPLFGMPRPPPQRHPDFQHLNDHPMMNGHRIHIVNEERMQNIDKRKGTPYIPSYMDLSNGPEPCVVCSDAATGYHYRCMTCEGCKGFFRRTIQKNLKYHCKWNGNCIIDKTTRNQCQECRFRKCVAVGMATDLVLNEKQRKAKRKLIEDNRERRRVDSVRIKPKHDCYHDCLTEEDRSLICDIIEAYEQTAVSVEKPYTVPEVDEVEKLEQTNPEVWQQLAEIMTPSIVKVVEFAKAVPGFINLNVDDQILLLKSCCMEIMCLRAACRYNPETKMLTLQSGLTLTRDQLGGGGVGLLIEPIFDFATSLSKLDLDETEIALLAAVLLMQSDRTGLREPEKVESLQDEILGAYKRYIAERRPLQPVHWAKILMKVTDLRTISTRHAERVLCIKLDAPSNIPSLFLEMFDEEGTSSRRSSLSGSLSRKSSLSDSVFGSIGDLTLMNEKAAMNLPVNSPRKDDNANTWKDIELSTPDWKSGFATPDWKRGRLPSFGWKKSLLCAGQMRRGSPSPIPEATAEEPSTSSQSAVNPPMLYREKPDIMLGRSYQNMKHEMLKLATYNASQKHTAAPLPPMPDLQVQDDK